MRRDPSKLRHFQLVTPAFAAVLGRDDRGRTVRVELGVQPIITVCHVCPADAANGKKGGLR
jgi:hypothetical protein